ncbi:Adaptin ear-binding coat-associated protein 1 [Nymphon striatum]|nr:Adaptin ear-binding coat-associated protein 1 [Nymphon striatum]
MEAIERILLVKPEVFVYKIPPRTSNRGYRAADWNLQTPDWTGKLILVNIDKDCILKLVDKNSGELFAKCLIDQYPGMAVESVSDSSRYFVIRIQDDSGRAAFIGIGFADRGDSFDLNVSLQDHFKWLCKSEEIAAEELQQDNKPQLDLGFKEGETIKIKMNINNKSSSRPKAKSSAGGLSSGLLPPPPGGMKIGPPPGNSTSVSAPLVTAPPVTAPPVTAPPVTEPPVTAPNTSDNLFGLDTSSSNSQNESSQMWSEFAGATNNG